jgi:hypothetical protein
MTIQRRLNSSLPINPRAGAPKITPDAPTKPGMRSRIAPSHEYQHGAPLQDEPNTPLKTYEQKIPLHPATPKRIADKVHPIGNDAGEILRDAANLGRRT